MSIWPDSFETPPIEAGSPVWDLARWMPAQGAWTEEDYFELDGSAVEFDQGTIEVLPMPSQAHQLLAQFFFLALHAFLRPSARQPDANDTPAQPTGRVLMAPVPVKLWAGKFREPDVVYLRPDRISDTPFCDGADLVLEVVSEGAGNRRRDLDVKPAEYAKAGIAEYWLLDPAEKIVRVHALNGTTYQSQDYHPGETAVSMILSGFSVDVTSWLNA